MTESQIKQWNITGAGGKGGGDAPTEDPDTLRSKAEAKVLCLFSEGEIQGFPTGATDTDKKKRIYLNDTPIIGPDGGDNFDDGVDFSFRAGTQDQPSLSGFNDVHIEQSVGVKLVKSVGPVSVTTTSSNLNRLIVRIGVGALYQIDEDDGDVKGTSVECRIQIFAATSNDPIIDTNKTISGKTRGAYDREYPFTLSGTGPWTVKLRRVTSDPENIKRVDDLYFKAIVGIIDQTLTYPNSALLGISVSAENFQSVPTISADLLGMKIKVPTIYNSGSNTYSGVWDGSWKVEYNNNPVWVFYDLLTNPRYGAGEFIKEADVDIYSLLPIAKYCDELVPNGKGGTEKRLTFNAYINNRGDAYQVLNSLAAAFRGMIYYAQGQIIATQDKPGTAIREFTPANVIIEMDESGQVTRAPFVYEGTGLKARKTVCLVSWNDRDDYYKSKIEYVEDREAIERYKYREIEVRALGCTSQGQAQRIGRWTLLTNLNETETVTFRVSAEGFFMVPGEIIEIADPNKTIGIYAGLAVSATTSSVTLDRSVLLQSGVGYEIIIRKGDGEEYTRSVTNGPGSTSVITFSPALSPAPSAPFAWVIRESTVVSRQYRVLGLTEDNGVVTVLASSYYAAKYSQVDDYTMLSSEIKSVAGVSVMPRVSAGSIVLEVT